MRAADAAGEPVLILGGGSNLVVSDEGFDGTVVQVATRGVSRDGGPGVLTVAAGEDWDDVVARSVAEGLAGPRVPVRHPRAHRRHPDPERRRLRPGGRRDDHGGAGLRPGDRRRPQIPNERCDFGYRTSRFRGAGRFVVLSVTFRLAVQVLSAPVRYAELAADPRRPASAARWRAPRPARRSSSSGSARAW